MQLMKIKNLFYTIHYYKKMFNEITTIEIINISLGLITAISASYLAYAALKHSARPHAKVYLREPKKFYTSTTEMFKFAFENAGHWYSKPIVVNMTVFLNFDENFDLFHIEYGSAQEIKDDNVRIGKGKMKFLKAKGLKLSYGEDDEEIYIKAMTPSRPGQYKIKISAYSENGLSLTKHFQIKVLKPIVKDEQKISEK
jgi:hypothetical protein